MPEPPENPPVDPTDAHIEGRIIVMGLMTLYKRYRLMAEEHAETPSVACGFWYQASGIASALAWATRLPEWNQKALEAGEMGTASLAISVEGGLSGIPQDGDPDESDDPVPDNVSVFRPRRPQPLEP